MVVHSPKILASEEKKKAKQSHHPNPGTNFSHVGFQFAEGAPTASRVHGVHRHRAAAGGQV